jgi:Secretion system C-terminal sorting domain/Right handed beta helix region
MKIFYPNPGKILQTKFLFTLLFSIIFSPSLFANTYTVTNTNDAGTGSLRQAIITALAAGTGPHTIDATAITGTISLQSALPTITNVTLTINGPSLNTGSLTITRGVGTSFRIFLIDNTGGSSTATLNYLILTNGNSGSTATDHGGGIRIFSAIATLNHCTISGCSASAADGGGISMEGANPSLTMDACNITGNTSKRGGGLSGINVTAGIAALTVTNSTFSDNIATITSGGINLTTTAGTFRNCTISGNRALTSNGGGMALVSSGSATMVNCTIKNNRAEGSGSGGGIRALAASTLVLTNSLVVGNFAGASPGTTADDITWAGPTNKTSNYSIVGVLNGAAFSSSTQSQAGTTGTPVVITLGTLGNNGGFSQTHRLLTSAPELAKDKGSLPSPALTNEQRGTARVIDDGGVANAPGGNGSDIGAYEMDNMVWNGGSSSVFDNSIGANWVEGTAPSPGYSVYVLEGPVTNDPVVSSNVTFVDLTLGPGRTLSINSGNTLAIANTFTHNGILKGNGTLASSNFTNNGIISPGSTSPGRLSLTGNYNNGSGALNIKLGGAVTAGTDYDQFSISGAATLSGTLNVSFVSGFTPAPGNQFVIMTFASQTGTFAVTNLPNVSPESWSVTYNATNVTLAVSGGTLPLKLVSFTAKLIDNNQTRLNWQTVYEQDMSRYETEWSKEGINWEKINVLAAINSTGTHNYSCVHIQLSPVNYYRLKMIDMDGKFTYSQVLRIDLGENKTLSIYPSPAKNNITVTLPLAGQALISIINSKGQVVLQKTVNVSATTLDVSTLPAGVYTMQVTQNEKNIIRRFVKQ